MTAKYAVVKNGSNLQEIQSGDRLNGESTGLYFDTVALTSANIAALGDGLNVVAAQGVGTITIPTFATLQFTPGTEPFAVDVGFAIGPAGEGYLTMTGDVLTATATESMLTNFTPASNTLATASMVNQPIMLVSFANSYTGSILTSSINTAGTGYVISDTITIGDALITVNTVDGGGAVLTYTVTDAGRGFIVDIYPQNSSSGAGTGFALSIDSITPLSNGTASLYIEYKIIQVD